MENNEKKSWDQANQQGKNQSDFNHEGSDKNFSEKERLAREEASNDDSKPQFGGSDASEAIAKNASGNNFDHDGINPITNISYTEWESDDDALQYNTSSNADNEIYCESDRELDRQVL